VDEAGQGQGQALPPIDTSRPHPARMYDWFLGGKDNYPVDREAARKVKEFLPEVSELAWDNRKFMHRASRMLAQRGIRQFLDIGTGIPTEPNLHQVVQAVAPDTRVVYVDNDPIVLRHAEALLRSTPEGRTGYIQADVREPQEIIDAAREVLSFEEPVALSMVALLHFVPDGSEPYDLVRQLLDPLPSGSYLVLTHATGDFDPETWARIIDIYRNSGITLQVRSRTEFSAFFTGLKLTEPGVELVTNWHPEPNQRQRAEKAPLYVGVAQK
jgi:hypothetical protein